MTVPETSDYENPFRPPHQDFRRAEPVRKRQFGLTITCAFGCGALTTAYGALGSLLNGLDLARTRSSEDLRKELWLLSILICGSLVCAVAYWMRNRQASVAKSVLAVAAVLILTTFGWVELPRWM